ncbi:hypothetical protein B7486_72835 [cyanobacterium TDX16]|nr:hypothetical protein B7486_72835 [cyanobacterium TDX16]
MRRSIREEPTVARVGNVRMVPLVTGSTAFEAKVLVARLGAEGILWELRGEVDSIYPIGRGVDVLVAEGDVVLARELLLGDEVDAAFDDGEPVTSRGSSWWVVAVAVVLLVAFTTVRFVGAAS